MFHREPIACRNLSSAPGARELEAEQPLVLEPVGAPAHHVAHVQLRHLVVAHVEHGVTGARHQREQRLLGAAAPSSAMPTKMRADCVSS